MSSFVYRIKHKDHTDIITQGYVGVTSKRVSDRFSTHKRVARKLESNIQQRQGEANVVHRAMVKYGEHIEIVTVCQCESEYAYWLENKLRPAPFIGWNISVGGKSNGMLGRNQSEKQKQIVSEMNRGKHVDTSHLVDAVS